MFCRKCGFQMEDSDGFCPRCGTATTEANIKSDGMSKYFSAPSGTAYLDSSDTDAAQGSSRIRFSKSFSPTQTTAVNSSTVFHAHHNYASSSNEPYGDTIPAKKMRSKTPIFIAAAAGVLLLLGILAIIIFPKLGQTSKNERGSESALSGNYQANQNTPSGHEQLSDYSYLHGSWNHYTGGTLTDYGAAGAEVTMLQLNADGTAKLYYYITNSGVGASYEGIWAADAASGNAVIITLNMRDYSEAVGEDRGNSYRYTEKISASVIGDTLEISNQTGDLNYFDAGIILERGLTLEDWTSRMQAQGYWKEDGTTPTSAPDQSPTVWSEYHLTQVITNGETQRADDVNKKGSLSFNNDGTGTLIISESYYNGGYMTQTLEFTWTQSGDMITLTYTTGAYNGTIDFCVIDGDTITVDNELVFEKAWNAY